MSTAYDDIIDLPHPTSVRHPRMPMTDRAAQFSPFQALTGYGAAIQETGRLTEERMDLTEDEKAILDKKLQTLMADGQEAVFTYFVADERKNGGAYLTVAGAIRRIDCLSHTVVLTSGAEIPVEDILSVE